MNPAFESVTQPVPGPVLCKDPLHVRLPMFARGCSCRIPWPNKPGAGCYPAVLHDLVVSCLQADPQRRPSVPLLLQQIDDLLSQPDAALAV
jgi:hypothetical protein